MRTRTLKPAAPRSESKLDPESVGTGHFDASDTVAPDAEDAVADPDGVATDTGAGPGAADAGTPNRIG
jgi:hypothetical protein